MNIEEMFVGFCGMGSMSFSHVYFCDADDRNFFSGCYMKQLNFFVMEVLREPVFPDIYPS